jgi:signal transduction histidine kinase
MNIVLCSANPELYRLCRDLLGEMPEHACTFSTALPYERPSEADLYIWDFEAEVEQPEHTDFSPLKHLFLVSRKDLDAFRTMPAATEANVLLKPVTNTVLRAFLTLAISSFEERIVAAASLREDRDEILQCLIQANLKLQEYDQDRTNFLARAIHDFRAPLTALSGYCGLLLAEPVGSLNEQQREILSRMQHSASRLSRMANAMFQLSIAPSVKRPEELQLDTLVYCLEQAIHEVTPFVDEKKLSISTDLGVEPPLLYFDHAQIEQLLINLLDNACKFTPKGGLIEIRGYPYFWDRREDHRQIAVSEERRVRNSREPNSFRLDVRESAKPIPPQYLESIFEEYTSYCGSEDRTGGGLGLAICKMVVSNHFGRIWAENSDFGPVFSVVLPLPEGVVNTQRDSCDELSEAI